MLQGLFARPPGLSAREKELGHTKEFTGDGTEYLMVPGLKKLDICRIGQTIIPDQTEQEFPDNTRPHGQATVKHFVPMLSLITDDDGNQILLRSSQSNHGIWQDGATIYITGDWDEVAPVVVASVAADASVEPSTDDPEKPGADDKAPKVPKPK